MTESDCIFCKIVAEEIPSVRVYEDLNTLAFMDINPVASGHALVIPKQHWPNLFEMPEMQLGNVLAATRKVAAGLHKALCPDGVSLIQANGKGAAQSVLHFHMHIVPRTLGDNLKINWKLTPGNMDEIRAIAERLISAMD